jgi:hypothetical protein
MLGMLVMLVVGFGSTSLEEEEAGSLSIDIASSSEEGGGCVAELSSIRGVM